MSVVGIQHQILVSDSGSLGNITRYDAFTHNTIVGSWYSATDFSQQPWQV